MRPSHFRVRQVGADLLPLGLKLLLCDLHLLDVAGLAGKALLDLPLLVLDRHRERVDEVLVDAVRVALRVHGHADVFALHTTDDDSIPMLSQYQKLQEMHATTEQALIFHNRKENLIE